LGIPTLTLSQQGPILRDQASKHPITGRSLIILGAIIQIEPLLVPSQIPPLFPLRYRSSLLVLPLIPTTPACLRYSALLPRTISLLAAESIGLRHQIAAYQFPHHLHHFTRRPELSSEQQYLEHRTSQTTILCCKSSPTSHNCQRLPVCDPRR
jgi:hypothetical protein